MGFHEIKNRTGLGSKLVTRCTITLSAALLLTSSTLARSDDSTSDLIAPDLNTLSWGSPPEPNSSVSNESQFEPETELQLLHVTSDVISGFIDFKISVNEDLHLQQAKLVNHENSVTSISLDQFKTGAVLMRSSDMEVVKLIAPNLNPATGGPIELIYLTNGISGSYSSFGMELVRSGQGWSLETNQTSRRRKFTQMSIKGRWVFGQIIGISEITVD